MTRGTVYLLTHQNNSVKKQRQQKGRETEEEEVHRVRVKVLLLRRSPSGTRRGTWTLFSKTSDPPCDTTISMTYSWNRYLFYRYILSLNDLQMSLTRVFGPHRSSIRTSSRSEPNMGSRWWVKEIRNLMRRQFRTMKKVSTLLSYSGHLCFENR